MYMFTTQTDHPLQCLAKNYSLLLQIASSGCSFFRGFLGVIGALLWTPLNPLVQYIPEMWFQGVQGPW